MHSSDLRRTPAAAVTAHVIGAVAAGLVVLPAVCAAVVRGAVGYDQSFGPRDQHAQAAMVVVSATSPGGSVYVAPSRYDHSVVGAGFGFGLGGSVRMAHGFAMQAAGTRFHGDHGYRGWRLRTGPAWGGPYCQTVAVSYLHDEGADVPPADGMIAEVSTPLTARVRGHASSVWAGRAGDVEVAAAVGATWTVTPALQLSGHGGMAHEGFAGAAAGSGAPGGPELLPPFLGNEEAPASGSAPDRRLYPTAWIALRILFPTASE